MKEWLLQHQEVIRLGVFLGLLILLGGLEFAFPKRQRVHSQSHRWLSNIGLSIVDSFVVRAVAFASPLGIALLVEEKQWGLLGLIDGAFWWEVLFSIILLDLVIYWQHVVFHRVPFLWRLHKVHHTDQDLDVSSAIRFHPIEILISIGVKLGAIALIGSSAVSVLLFEVILNGTALFNHSNLRLPKGLEQVLRYFIVTPDMHQVHHSVMEAETNSNYGFNLPWWDRLFGSYVAQPQKGHDGMVVGLENYQRVLPFRLLQLLTLPFQQGSKNQ